MRRRSGGPRQRRAATSAVDGRFTKKANRPRPATPSTAERPPRRRYETRPSPRRAAGDSAEAARLAGGLGRAVRAAARGHQPHHARRATGGQGRALERAPDPDRCSAEPRRRGGQRRVRPGRGLGACIGQRRRSRDRVASRKPDRMIVRHVASARRAPARSRAKHRASSSGGTSRPGRAGPAASTPSIRRGQQREGADGGCSGRSAAAEEDRGRRRRRRRARDGAGRRAPAREQCRGCRRKRGTVPPRRRR